MKRKTRNKMLRKRKIWRYLKENEEEKEEEKGKKKKSDKSS